MSVLIGLRLAKYLGVLALAMGTAGGLVPLDGDAAARIRQRAVYWLATPGFLLTWIAGWGMAKHTAVSLGAPWISISMLASLISLHELIRGVEPGRSRSKVRAAVIVLGLVVATAAMVVRNG